MAKTDLRSNVVLVVAMAASTTLSGATPLKGDVVDTLGFNSVTFLYATSAVTDAGDANGFSVELQDSTTTNDADFVAVADEFLIGRESELTVTSDSADNRAIGTLGYKGDKRYVRVVITGSTGTNAFVRPAFLLGANISQPTLSTVAFGTTAT